MPKTSEIAFNVALANVLRIKHPRWRDHTSAKQKSILRGVGGYHLARSFWADVPTAHRPTRNSSPRSDLGGGSFGRENGLSDPDAFIRLRVADLAAELVLCFRRPSVALSAGWPRRFDEDLAQRWA